MIKVIVGIFLVLHGFVHLLYFGQRPDVRVARACLARWSGLFQSCW
jgi:hypothetical protein